MEGHAAPPGYRITSRLGSDASAMYLAVHEATGTAVTLRFVDVPSQAAYDAVVGIVPTIRAFEHQHVLPVLDLVEGPHGGLVAVLDAADGGSLAGILGARGTLPAGEVVTACAPVADALAEAHRRGLIHGDLTLDDLVFTLDGKPMIAGIGLVQAGAAMRPGQFSRPVPPELQAGAPAGPATDVYGLVTAAIVALTGYVPQARLSLPGVAPAAEATLATALDPNPRRRPPAASVGNALFAVADPQPVELVLVEGPLTTGSLPRVEVAEPPTPDDDIAAYMRGATSTGRRARRRAQAAAGSGAASTDDRETPAEEPVRRRGRRGRRKAAGEEAASARSAPPTRTEPTRTEPTPAEPSRPTPPRFRRRMGKSDWTKIVSGLVAALLIAGAAVVLYQMFGDDDPLPDAGRGASASESASTELCGGPRPAPTQGPPAVTDWTQEVQRLYSLRAQAFEELDAGLLCQVFSPTSAALAEDAATVKEYRDAGVRPEGLTFEVVTAEVVSQTGGRAELAITDRIPGYRLVDDDGNVVEEKEGTEQQTWTAELVAVADSENAAPTWRFG